MASSSGFNNGMQGLGRHKKCPNLLNVEVDDAAVLLVPHLQAVDADVVLDVLKAALEGLQLSVQLPQLPINQCLHEGASIPEQACSEHTHTHTHTLTCSYCLPHTQHT